MLIFRCVEALRTCCRWSPEMTLGWEALEAYCGRDWATAGVSDPRAPQTATSTDSYETDPELWSETIRPWTSPDSTRVASVLTNQHGQPVDEESETVRFSWHWEVMIKETLWNQIGIDHNTLLLWMLTVHNFYKH